ncbi:MAG: DUF6242 domain-containing protein, partial [Paludibacter sp.]|nr:DUF6242 domain-containing protein [Paludibacter sp.]
MYKIGIKLLSSLSLIMLLSSCNWFGGSEEIPELPAGSAFKSLTFAANDSFPGLAKASFEVLPDTLYVNGELLSDSTIVNLDSLPYNTNITRVISTFSWQSISKAYIVSIDSTGALSDTTYLTGKDTIDFSRAVKIVNFAKDGNEEHRSQYLIKVNVHKVNPYLFVWQKIADEIYSHPVAQQKAVYFGSQIMLYASSESENYLYTSQNGKDWTDNTAAISGLPSATTIDLSQIVEFNGKLFLLDSQHNIYSSSDGFQWTGHGFPSLKSLLGVYKNELWAILQSTDNTY